MIYYPLPFYTKDGVDESLFYDFFSFSFIFWRFFYNGTLITSSFFFILA